MRFIELAGKDAYMARLGQWSGLTKVTQEDLGLDTSQFFTTSVIVVESVITPSWKTPKSANRFNYSPEYKRKGFGRLLDEAARAIVSTNDHVVYVKPC